MPHLEFYIIRSSKSEQRVRGLRPIGLACDQQPDIHGFLWVDDQETLQQAQFLFDETVIEWRRGLGFSGASTNRFGSVEQSFGRMKGARTMETAVRSQELEGWVKSLKAATFPEELGALLRQEMLAQS